MLMEEHPGHGYELLKDIQFPWPIADFVRQHHERIDGSGYPLGLKGENISPEAKILGVADTIEAMSTHRPYRPALGLPVALAEITSEAGIKFDVEVVNAAIKLFFGKEKLDEIIH
jgi:HD-GYP domain-containing protein (c-di-GMP phosphodiesterase class II)